MVRGDALGMLPIEMRLHGRGGQGTVTLAALIVDAAVAAGWYALGFPSFGTERTGAPVAAFVRLDRRPIQDRSQVAAPHVIVVQDATLLGAVPVFEGAHEDAVVLINASRLGDEAPEGVLVVPATELAVNHLGKPITNTAMLGAVAAATRLFDLDDVAAAIEHRFAGAVAEANVAVARAAFERTTDRRAVA